ncbi:putative secreted protein [Xanthomonas bromi]|uniref:Putative secreted protein n=1 Tax=Xanthomonas bromi TaxID=56449 RepID=A0A1C3NQW1_9XANT|nr:hypothetical protein [Xanthomonas bromi]PPV05291.1 hypothetical protein XbrCFBP1976_17720 [Xanthomonas bromi]SBV52761.1 putative secreted protein [Xanthomonas bromi]
MQVKFRLLLLLVALAVSGCVHAQDQGTDPYAKLGGSIRLNYGWLDYGPTRGLDLELLRVDLNAGAGPVFVSIQHRWYDGFDAVHHAFVGWNINDKTVVKAGIQQVPFGLLPTASNSFWFGSGYYLGIEDDYDPGVVLTRTDGANTWHVGWFMGDEYGDGARYDRYSFDVAETKMYPYRERHRIIARYERRYEASNGVLLFGASAFSGHVLNVDSRNRHTYGSAAVHAQWSSGRWTSQLQWARYRYDVPGERIAISAFMFPFEVAAKADVPTANIAYSFGKNRWLDDITCYNNLSQTVPYGDIPGVRTSTQNVTGCSVKKGIMLTYLDWIAGKNMWFAGGNGIAIDDGDRSRWHSRFNLNIGFYF